MKKIAVFITIQLLIFNSLRAQVADSIKYPLIIKFSSVCCGVPSDIPLKNEIKHFKSKNRIKTMRAIKISPMGREGEYWICFKLGELSKKQKINFSDKLCKITKKMTDKGSANCETNSLVIKSALSQNVKMEKINY